MFSYQVDSARMKKDLATLVAINTENPPGHEREAAECLEGWLLTAGFGADQRYRRPAQWTGAVLRL